MYFIKYYITILLSFQISSIHNSEIPDNWHYQIHISPTNLSKKESKTGVGKPRPSELLNAAPIANNHNAKNFINK